jgi:hypothetical protein
LLTRLTVLTVLWVRFSPMAVILMVRVQPPLAAENNLNPEVRRKVCIAKSLIDSKPS